MCRQLFKGSTDLSLVAHSFSPEQLFFFTFNLFLFQVERNVFKARRVAFILQNRIKYDNYKSFEEEE